MHRVQVTGTPGLASLAEEAGLETGLDVSEVDPRKLPKPLPNEPRRLLLTFPLTLALTDAVTALFGGIRHVCMCSRISEGSRLKRRSASCAFTREAVREGL